jgi:hypothetical protein
MQLSLQNFSSLMEGMAAAVQGAASSLVDLTVGSVLRAILEANASVALWLQWLIVWRGFWFCAFARGGGFRPGYVFTVQRDGRGHGACRGDGGNNREYAEFYCCRGCKQHGV